MFLNNVTVSCPVEQARLVKELAGEYIRKDVSERKGMMFVWQTSLPDEIIWKLLEKGISVA